MLKWLKKLRGIVSRYDDNLRSVHARINDLETVIRDRTNIAVDAGFRDANYVIVVGRYRNADYVQIYTLGTSDLAALIDQLRHMQRHAVVRRIDAPPLFRAVFERDVRKL